MSNSNPNARKNKPSSESLRSILKRGPLKVHFVGIGGVSMYSLAILTVKMGHNVSGSDIFRGERSYDLVLRGVSVFTEHSADCVKDRDLVVYSHAVSNDNPELVEAERLGIPTFSRAEYLGELMLGYKNKIGVSGTHGKSTTVAMLERIFTSAGTNPTVLSGAKLESGSPIREGDNSALIYEACEYKDSFLSFSPSVSVALNLELDHPDYFADIYALRSSFTKALSRATGFAVINIDDENLEKILPQIKKRTRAVTFGQSDTADYSYFISSFEDGYLGFTLYHFAREIETFRLSVPGVHNVSNAVAAIVVALEYGIPIDIIKEAIAGFSGIERRLEYIGERGAKKIYYDYAHHPTEIAAAINTIRLMSQGPITVVFKPHTYSRTAELWESFCSSLSLADRVIVTDIYPARENAIEGVNSKRLAEDIGSFAEYSPDSEVAERLDLQHGKGVVVLMGAGDLDNVKYDILNK